MKTMIEEVFYLIGMSVGRALECGVTEDLQSCASGKGPLLVLLSEAPKWPRWGKPEETQALKSVGSRILGDPLKRTPTSRFHPTKIQRWWKTTSGL